MACDMKSGIWELVLVNVMCVCGCSRACHMTLAGKTCALFYSERQATIAFRRQHMSPSVFTSGLSACVSNRISSCALVLFTSLRFLTLWSDSVLHTLST